MYHPPGRPFGFGKSLAVEFSTEVLQAILVIWLLAQTRIGSFAGRVGFVLIAGILASMTTNVSYWNWYGFPGVYTASYILIEILFRSYWSYCRAGTAKAQSGCLKLMT